MCVFCKKIKNGKEGKGTVEEKRKGGREREGERDREGEREGEREGKGESEGKEKNKGAKKEEKGKEENGQGGQCKRTEKLWDQSDNTGQRVIRDVYSIILAQGWQKRSE